MIDTKIDFITYACGLCNLSACVPKDMPREDVEKYANLDRPTGIPSQWQISRDATFRTGQPNPCPCNDHPEERLHYLLNC